MEIAFFLTRITLREIINVMHVRVINFQWVLRKRLARTNLNSDLTHRRRSTHVFCQKQKTGPNLFSVKLIYM